MCIPIITFSFYQYTIIHVTRVLQLHFFLSTCKINVMSSGLYRYNLELMPPKFYYLATLTISSQNITLACVWHAWSQGFSIIEIWLYLIIFICFAFKYIERLENSWPVPNKIINSNQKIWSCGLTFHVHVTS